MNGLGLVVISALVLALAYRFYGAFLASRALVLRADAKTPAQQFEDGKNFHVTNKYVTFGHHFAAIAGAGPLVGPVLAAQFGYLPGMLWLLIGGVLAGGVHDFVVLVASIRSNGRSLAEIAKENLSPMSGAVTMVAILFIITTALAGLAMVVVNALADSAWGTFTILLTIPIAMLVGGHMEVWRKGKVKEASIIGVVLVLLAVVVGAWVHHSEFARLFTYTKGQLSIGITVYGFLASVLPVWLLLAPRDYLSSYMKIGTIALLALGIIFVCPEIRMPAVTDFINGGGPIIPGKVWPFVCITVACGAISGWHSLIASGTTPKMLAHEPEALFVGYGAMLMETFVAVMALIAATVLLPNDYLAINVDPAKWSALGIVPVELDHFSKMVNEDLAGRTGGAVTLAVGMAHIFSKLPGMGHLMAYWYHYAIMFEALFILTTVDAGTRVGRYMIQEVLGRIHPKLGDVNYWPTVLLTGGLISVAWGYLLCANDITSIWPMFGVANQLLATLALVVGTGYLVKHATKPAYALITALPAVFMAATTLVAGYSNVFDNFIPKGQAGNVNGYINAALTVVMIVCVIIVLVDGGWRIARNLSLRREQLRTAA
ncbi:MAG: carbon starvation protein A [Verrucomicrobiia bacterium]